MTTYLDYDDHADDCVRFVRTNWPEGVKQTWFDGEERWFWRNADGHFFTFETEAEACADFCLETGVTEDELNKGVAA